jgi:acyl carrier protein
LVKDFEVERDRISLDANLAEDLGLDSLDAIDMLVRLQEIAQRRIDEDAVREIRTMRGVVDLAERYLTESPSPE